MAAWTEAASIGGVLAIPILPGVGEFVHPKAWRQYATGLLAVYVYESRICMEGACRGMVWFSTCRNFVLKLIPRCEMS